MLLEQTSFYAPRYRNRVSELQAISHRCIAWGVEGWDDIETSLRASQMSLGHHEASVPFQLYWNNADLLSAVIDNDPWCLASTDEFVVLEYSFVGSKSWFTDYRRWLMSAEHHRYSGNIPVGRRRPHDPVGIVGFDAFVDIDEGFASRHAKPADALNRFGLFERYDDMRQAIDRYPAKWPILPAIVGVRIVETQSG